MTNNNNNNNCNISLSEILLTGQYQLGIICRAYSFYINSQLIAFDLLIHNK